MEKIKIGDIVGRKSYNKDILFRVKNIINTKSGQIAILIGIIERVEADSNLNDLEKVSRKRINESVSLNLVGSGIKESITSIIDEMYKDIKASNISQVLSPSLIANIIRDTLITQVDRYMIPIYSELSDIPLLEQ